MYAVIIEKVSPDAPITSGLKQVHYFASIHKAKEFALDSSNKNTQANIFEETGVVYGGVVSMSNKFERSNHPIPGTYNGKDKN